MSIFTDGERLLERYGERSFSAFLWRVLGSKPHNFGPDKEDVRYPGSRISNNIRKQLFGEMKALLESEEGKNLFLYLCLSGITVDFGLLCINRRGVWVYRGTVTEPTKTSLFSIMKDHGYPNDVASKFKKVFQDVLTKMNRGERKAIRS